MLPCFDSVIWLFKTLFISFCLLDLDKFSIIPNENYRLWSALFTLVRALLFLDVCKSLSLDLDSKVLKDVVYVHGFQGC